MGNHTSMRARGRSGGTSRYVPLPDEARGLNAGANKWRNWYARTLSGGQMYDALQDWRWEHRDPTDVMTVRPAFRYQQQVLAALVDGYAPIRPSTEQERADYRKAIAQYKSIRDDGLDRLLSGEDARNHLEPGTAETLLNRGFMVAGGALLPGEPSDGERQLMVWRADGQSFRGANGFTRQVVMPSAPGMPSYQTVEVRYGDARDVVFFSYLVDAHPLIIAPMRADDRAALAANHASSRARGHEVKTYDQMRGWDQYDYELRPYYAKFGK